MEEPLREQVGMYLLGHTRTRESVGKEMGKPPALAPWAMFMGEVGEKANFLLNPFRLQITWRSMTHLGFFITKEG